jgi:hypothetical protein
LRKTVAHFGFRVSLLHLLLDVAAIVRDFYYKFRHWMILLPFPGYSPPASV